MTSNARGVCFFHSGLVRWFREALLISLRPFPSRLLHGEAARRIRPRVALDPAFFVWQPVSIRSDLVAMQQVTCVAARNVVAVVLV